MNNVRLGSRVWYKEGGDETDIGTIVDILLDEAPFVVKWDRQSPSVDVPILFPPKDIAEQLGVEQQCIIMNKADENIDQFRGDQLGVLVY